MTDLQLREQRIREVIDFAGINGDEFLTLRQQLDSLTNLGIEVAHTLVTRVGAAQYEPVKRIARRR